MDVAEATEVGLNHAAERLAQTFSHRPESVGILVACALIVTAIAMIFTLLQLAPVLVPLSFAIFLAFLVEPILAAIVFAPQNIVRFVHSTRRGADTIQRSVSVRLQKPAPPQSEAKAPRGDVELASFDVDVDATAIKEPCSEYDCNGILARLQQTWDIISILLCVVALLALIAAVVLGFYGTVDAADWQKYTSSPRLQEIYIVMDRLGVNNTSWQEIVDHYKAEVISVSSGLVGIVGNVVVTLLLFFFCLVAILPGIRQQIPKSRMRSMMQRYLLCKTLTSLVIALATMLSLWVLDVDMVIIFGIMTFFLNFIPNVGSLISILAPVPFVFLTPGKDINDAIIVVIVPFLIHNSLGCTLEPQLMQAGLDLHPLTVVVALTFWGAVWGAAGMVLSVPITCALRLWLEEVDHPHARLIHDMMDQPLGVRRKTTRSPSPASSCSSSSARCKETA